MNQPILEIKDHDLHLFLQQGFFDFHAHTSKLHSHGYAEIHIVLSGQLGFFIEGLQYTFSAGTIFAIPQNMYHCCTSKEESTQSIAFQIKKDTKTVKTNYISSELLDTFVQELKKAGQSQNFTIVSRYISLFCGSFLSQDIIQPTESTDYSLIINEFFSNRYNQQVTVQSLADELNLSEKQTARLVKKYTGYTFNEELTRRRISIADYLIQTSSMTLAEIAEYVGFKSYSGFWKVYKKRQIPLNP